MILCPPAPFPRRTAEGGPVEIGRNCVIMENAVVRGVPGEETRIGDDVILPVERWMLAQEDVH
jgi:acetyltransferase-like isoleucine patch superfamily enzyme